MRTYIDSSAFAKRYVNEAGSEKVDAVCAQTTELGLSVICVPEIISALNRRKREKSISQRGWLIHSSTFRQTEPRDPGRGRKG